MFGGDKMKNRYYFIFLKKCWHGPKADLTAHLAGLFFYTFEMDHLMHTVHPHWNSFRFHFIFGLLRLDSNLKRERYRRCQLENAESKNWNGKKKNGKEIAFKNECYLDNEKEK